MAGSFQSSRTVQGLTIAASLALHAGLSALLSSPRVPAEPPSDGQASASAEPGASRSARGEVPPVDGTPVELTDEESVGDAPRVTAGTGVAHFDRGTPGRGGDATARERALNFADDPDRMSLSPDALNRLDRDQIQRLRVARSRSSWEDRRSTTHPGELTLVTTGPGYVRERRPSAAWAPSRGALDSPAASLEGAASGAPMSLELLEAGDPGERFGGAQQGSSRSAPGTGLMQGREGTDHRRSAPVGETRPAVTQAAVAVPALVRARPRDDVDSQQEVASTVRSLVLASAAGGMSGACEAGHPGQDEASNLHDDSLGRMGGRRLRAA
ncbi:MAG: hypothetical protein ACRENE_19050, partial [Polyangiaceae bacterium]